MYDQAPAAAQAAEERSIINAENAWQRNLAYTQATALDTIRKNNASAIATGASKGMQAANELSAKLGLQDTAVEESTALAQQRLDLADAYAAEYAKNAVTAQETANANKQAMMSAAMEAYAADTTLEASHFNSPETGMLKYASDFYAKGDEDSIARGNAILNALGIDYNKNTTTGAAITSSTPVSKSDTLYVNKDKHANDAPILSLDRTIHLTEVTDSGQEQNKDYKVHEKPSAEIEAALRNKGMVRGQVMQYGENLYIMGHSGTIRRISEK